MTPPDYHPEPPVNPPEISDKEYNRQVRNAWRADGIDAIDLIDELLGYLSDGLGFKRFRQSMADVRAFLESDMED